MQSPTPVPIPLPISFGPHEADWLMVWLTAAGVIASSVVAISALVSSSRAKSIAEASERARVTAEEKRVAREYELRLEEALAVLIGGITEYLAALRPAVASGGASPEADVLVTSIQLARLRAEGEDVQVVAHIADLLQALVKPHVRAITRAEILKDLVIGIREWKTRVQSREAFTGWLRGKTTGL